MVRKTSESESDPSGAFERLHYQKIAFPRFKEKDFSFVISKKKKKKQCKREGESETC